MREKIIKLVVCLVLLAVLLLSGNVFPVSAAESYTLTPSATRILESSSSGVTLIVLVNNAIYTPPTTYFFSWAVKSPAGTSTSTTSNVLSTSSSWAFSVNYPSSFSGASLNLPGLYSVNVSETLPAANPNVVTGSFIVGITDNSTYQRTLPVRIQAGGYLPSDTVNMSITQSGSPAQVFSSSKTADTNGLVTASWLTLPSTPVGSYTLTVVGKNTPPKGVPDTQQFIVYPTNVTTTGFRLSKNVLEKSQNLGFQFNATYLNGLSTTQGSGMIRIIEPDGLTSHLTFATYNSSLGRFSAIFAVPLNGETGAWTASIAPQGFTDPFGNGGPLQPMSASFNVLPATLVISLQSSARVFTTGDALPVQASVITPGGANYTAGTVDASLTLSGQRVATSLSLSYDQTRGLWIGSYKVAPTDPSGVWLVTVSASDSYGNAGQSSVTESVNVPPPPITPATVQLWLYLLPVLVIAALGCIMLIFRKRGVTRREVKLDIQAIKGQADKVKSDDFLQSIQAQLKKRKEQMGLEKSDHD